MKFTAYILDVLTDSVYPARIKIDNGVFAGLNRTEELHFFFR